MIGETDAVRVPCQPGPLLDALQRHGYAILPSLLDPDTCAQLIGMYDERERFRSHVVMERHGFGRGEYRYFTYPLPAIVQDLRTRLYPPLAAVANAWSRACGWPAYPETHEAYLQRCRASGQLRPTPLLLKYVAGDYNCLHQDLYGEEVFPLQAVILLSREDAFAGGELVLTEQRPRAQSRAEVVRLRQGDAAVIPTSHRPVPGKRGTYRVNMRHGVSRVLAGTRHVLGVVFHDAR